MDTSRHEAGSRLSSEVGLSHELRRDVALPVRRTVAPNCRPGSTELDVELRTLGRCGRTLSHPVWRRPVSPLRASGVQAGALEDLVDGVLRAVRAMPTRSRSAPATAATTAAVVGVVTGREHLLSCRSRSGSRAGARGSSVSAESSALPSNTSTGTPSRLQVLLAVGVLVRRADEFRMGRRDAADQERGDVEPLPGLEVVAHDDGDLGRERRGQRIVGHGTTPSSRESPGRLVRS